MSAPESSDQEQIGYLIPIAHLAGHSDSVYVHAQKDSHKKTISLMNDEPNTGSNNALKAYINT